MINSIFNEKAVVVSNKLIASNTYEATMQSPKISKSVIPGQFINILPNDSWNKVMRRPMSVSFSNKDLIGIIYKVVGEGTKILSQWKKGDQIDIIGPLGNYWDNFNEKTPIIIGGGVGVAPILFFHNYLRDKGINHHMIMGARNKEEHFLEHSYNSNEKYHCILTTDDGSLGVKGNVLDGLKLIDNLNRFKIFVCGPPLMMESVKLLSEKKDIECNVALETIMACGFGICQGCTVEFKNNKKNQYSYRNKYGLVCCDGPIFNAKDIKTCLL